MRGVAGEPVDDPLSGDTGAVADTRGTSRCLVRRRGETLASAIHAATVAELQAVGYSGFTMERVASAARTGKAALYRRWAGKDELILDALSHAFPVLDDAVPSGDLRDDLVSCLRAMIDSVNTPAGCALQTLLGESSRDHTFLRSLQKRVLQRRQEQIRAVLAAAAARGELRTSSPDPIVFDVGAALVLHRLVVDGPPLPVALAERIVDQVLLPVVLPGDGVGAPEHRRAGAH